MIEDPSKEGKTCTRCCYHDDSEYFQERCPGSPNGKHRMARYNAAVSVVTFNFYDIRSPKTIATTMAQDCYPVSCYHGSRLLTAKEVSELVSGRARLEVSVVQNAARNAGKQKGATHVE